MPHALGLGQTGRRCSEGRMKRYRIRQGAAPKVKLNDAGQPRERFEGLRLEAYREWIRSLPCILVGREGHTCWSPEKVSDACHVESKARGAGDAGNLYPGCRRAHQEEHNYGRKSFEAFWGVKLREIAGALWLKYEAEHGAPVL